MSIDYCCHYTNGKAGAWAFRWLFGGTHGKYLVTVIVDGFFCKNFDAVVDDFGNLVRVS